MLSQHKLVISLALALSTLPASAGTISYVTNGFQFGTVDLANGVFTPVGPGTPEGISGLAPGPNGSLLTLTYSGLLESINPATGVSAVIGPTGLADCSLPTSPCGPTSANMLGGLGGKTYVTDFRNDLYIVNPLTGAATLIGPTGIPALPFIPLSNNPDGTFNAYDESLFSAGGNLYATFDAITVDPSTFTITPVISPDLYRIDPSTGHATLVAPTALLGAVVDVNGTVYAFEGATSQVLALNLANGGTTVVSGFDPAAGIITGASPAAAPEPASIVMAGLGIAAMVICKRRRRRL
jgi:hypothetical protein